MNKLPVPENIPLRWELMRGFGKAETVRSALITLTVLIACIVWCVCTGSDRAKVISVIIVLCTMMVCVGFFGRMDNNTSIYSYLLRAKRYRQEQQNFKYVLRNEVITYVQNENQD